MSPTSFDICVLTDRRYINPIIKNDYINNVVKEDQLVLDALLKKGLKAIRKSWDDPDFNWSECKALLFRTTWDYFDRFDEFEAWLAKVKPICQLINSDEIIFWNLDKKYLFDLEERGVRIPSGRYIEKGCAQGLCDILEPKPWNKVILKPAISGAARHTYLFDKREAHKYEDIFQKLIGTESMIVQEFQENIMHDGEISIMIFGDQYSHAVIKKAKAGDFRVQDDHGGTVKRYVPTNEEIEFAIDTLSKCHEQPIYARVDLMRDNSEKLCLGELELIEPELWFRLNPSASDLLADVINRKIR